MSRTERNRLDTRDSRRSPESRPRAWFPLDNAALIYAAMLGSRSTTAFRFTAVMRQPVEPAALQAALDATMVRYPYFGVRLRYGLFWNFLQPLATPPRIAPEREYPCSDFTGRSHLFRVLYFGSRISIEFSHVLTDGMGGLKFAQQLLEHYVRISAGGEAAAQVKSPREQSGTLAEEFEDSYERFYPERIPHFKSPGAAYHPPGNLLPNGERIVITGTCPKAAIIGACKERSVSVTEFLAAQYLWALYRTQRHDDDDIRLLVPVNLRELYPSKTMRNFFLTVFPEIHPSLGTYTFEEVLKAVHHYMQVEVDERYINRQIARNVALTRNPLNRVIPLFLKLAALRMAYSHSGSRTASGVFSNIGAIRLSPAASAAIERIVFVTSPNHVTKYSTGVAGFGEHMTITFNCLTDSAQVPRLFFTALRTLGIPVKIETNLDEKELPWHTARAAA
jgi:hypothetical protein